MSQSTQPVTYKSKLQGARVLILGGSSGVGFGVAQALLEHGASVIISSSSPDRVAKAVQRLEASHPQGHVQGIACNLGSQEHLVSDVGKLVTEVAKGGKLDHVVHTAGDAMAIGKLEDFSLAEIQQAGMVRFFSPFIVAQHLRKLLKDGPASSYIMTTGGASERPMPDWTVVLSYITGLVGMMRGLAKDLAPIRVNLVALGPVETELWDSFRAQGAYEAVKESFEKGMATGTIGKVEDIVESYLYLMKDKNATGSTVTSNGGMVLM
ncbi:NAD(P)-binding protein [Acaromyces ingoldii]|uniref:NAD(P)-binding protein n=1 Tax=Acaromyces ingoldii TaxID=215250 RepID=A0A316YFX7_9BASI|nr:NAD(P)-binding protein [Acaromyces ingoldii]PWN87986.1 NAD(P)-binding protein [Acaromyces ingoldii]